MPTKSYEELLLEELRDPDLAAEYLTATLNKRSLSSVKSALKKVVEAHGGAETIQEIAGLSAQELEQLFGSESDLTLRPLLALLSALGMSVCFLPEEASQT